MQRNVITTIPTGTASNFTAWIDFEVKATEEAERYVDPNSTPSPSIPVTHVYYRRSSVATDDSDEFESSDWTLLSSWDTSWIGGTRTAVYHLDPDALGGGDPFSAIDFNFSNDVLNEGYYLYDINGFRLTADSYGDDTDHTFGFDTVNIRCTSLNFVLFL